MLEQRPCRARSMSSGRPCPSAAQKLRSLTARNTDSDGAAGAASPARRCAASALGVGQKAALRYRCCVRATLPVQRLRRRASASSAKSGRPSRASSQRRCAQVDSARGSRRDLAALESASRFRSHAIRAAIVPALPERVDPCRRRARARGRADRRASPSARAAQAARRTSARTKLARERAKPVRGERHVRRPLRARRSPAARAALVAGAAKALGEALGVVEVAGLEAEAHHGAGTRPASRRGHALPEPVAHRERRPARKPSALDVRGVHAHVADLVVADARSGRA